MTMEEHVFVSCKNLVKIYKIADLEVVALQGLNLDVAQGDMVALVGPSGAGKSTLLNIIGGLDVPSAGAVNVNGIDLLQMKQAERVQYKLRQVGFVWQQPARNLLPYLTAKENVTLPMLMAQVPPNQRERRAMELLDIVDLADRANFRPVKLSGGQQQRVAIAVALANNPPLLLGDELTGQVDSQSASEVFEALRNINAAFNTTIIMVTHDPFVAGIVDRLVAIRDGQCSTEVRRKVNDDNEVVHEEEWVILDPVGRLQLPQPFTDHLGLSERVKVRLEEEHISIWPGITIDQSDVNVTLRDELDWTGQQTQSAKSITLSHVSRTFQLENEEIHAVQDVSAAIEPGTLSVLKGRSGSGKTTLLNLIGGLDDATSGQIVIGDDRLDTMRNRARIQLRRKQIGFVYQTFGLLPFLSAEENVSVALRLLRLSGKERRQRISDMLELVGLKSRTLHRVYELSGGEQQRVAIARALVKYPGIILADEPTGQLDAVTGQAILHLLRKIVDDLGVTVVIASHDAKVMDVADTVLELRDGMLVSTV